MLSPGPAIKVTIYLNEDTSAAHDFLFHEIFSFLYSHGVAGATLHRPQAGFGSHHHLHSEEMSPHSHMPVRIQFVETRAVVDALMPALCELITDGLIEAHETMVIKAVARQEPV